MVKSNGTLVNKEDISEETNFELLSNGTTFLNFSINSLEFLTVYADWLSGNSNLARL